jgi:hypothetical protein
MVVSAALARPAAKMSERMRVCFIAVLKTFLGSPFFAKLFINFVHP